MYIFFFKEEIFKETLDINSKVLYLFYSTFVYFYAKHRNNMLKKYLKHMHSQIVTSYFIQTIKYLSYQYVVA